MQTRPIRAVVISEDTHTREALTQLLDGLASVDVAAEVTLVCQMGNQAGHVAADAVVLDVDRYPLAGTLSLAQARATFPDARIVVLVRDVEPHFPNFLKASGASCCLDKDDPEHSVHLVTEFCAFAAAGNGTVPRSSATIESPRFEGITVRPRTAERDASWTPAHD